MRLSLILFFYVFLFTQSAFSNSKLPIIKFETLNTQALSHTQESWFSKEFVRSFMAVYKDKTFVITKEGKPMLLTKHNHDTTEKEQWLLETAQKEFKEYVISPPKGYKALLISSNSTPVGAILYRLDNHSKTIYLAQYFILPEYQNKKIGTYFLETMLPKLHEQYNKYEVLARHQNEAAILLYNRLGFTIGNIELVKKYGYDPLRYMSFYKELTK